MSIAPSPLAWDLVAAAYTAELVPVFERFAAGPGTLTLPAARTAARVAAIDFAPEMIARLEARARSAQLSNIEAVLGDGQALPWPDASFDAAFSLFGLIFFPDRAKALAELARVLAPGGRVVITSWPGPEHMPPMLRELFTALRQQTGGGGAPPLPPALGSPEAIGAELGAAGFHDVTAQPVVHGVDFPSLDACWGFCERTSAPLALLRDRVGEEAWKPIGAALREHLRARFGEGPQRIEMLAYLGVGRR